MALTEFTVKAPFQASAPTCNTPLRVLKALLNSYVFQHVSHVFRALANAKSMAMQLLNKKTTAGSNTCNLGLRRISSKNIKNKKKASLFGTINKLHQQLKWLPSSYKHLIPMIKRPLPSQFISDCFATSHSYYYDSTWDSVACRDDNQSNITNNVTDEIMEPSDQLLLGYLAWLEEENDDYRHEDEDNKHENEIDKLAEKFIAKCYEKFRLEKQESYRRYQEMLARSI